MNQEIITNDGEVLEGLQINSSMAVQLQKAEIDQLITTARAFPRSMKRVQSAIMSMATLDEESAEECMYALPRGGKPIKGPSIRFAEILKQSFGNCRAAARVVAVDRVEMFVEAEGVFHDLETNSSTTARVRRRISDKSNRIFKDDMIIVTGNAACSIAMRNAILAGVPKPLWRKAYDTVQATITGDVTTLTENREKALKALAAFGVKPDQIFASLGREGVEDISVDDIATLRGMYAALKNGEATVEEMFFGTVKGHSTHEKIADPLSDEPAKPQKPTDTQEGSDREYVAQATENVSLSHVEPENEYTAPSSQDAVDADHFPGDLPEGAEVAPPASAPSTNPMLVECCRKLMNIAIDDQFDKPTRRGLLIDAKDAWKEILKDADQDMLKAFFMSADQVIKGNANYMTVIQHYAEMLGVTEKELDA